MKNTIKEFITAQKSYFSDGFDIEDVKKAYKKAYNVTPRREDVTDAIIELKKAGILKYDLIKLKMRWSK